MACNGEDCKVEWIRFRKVIADPIRVSRRPPPDKTERTETFDKDSEEWAAAKALVKRWIEPGLNPIHQPIKAHSCNDATCECKPTETPDESDDKRWGPWAEGHVVFLYTDDKGEESIVVPGEISRTTGPGICRDGGEESVIVPK